MFRAGLSGTNWTGKTETIRTFVTEHSELTVRAVSLSSLVDKCPFPMVENQTVEASRWMIEKVGAICAKNNADMELFDRTPVDILAFTLYAEKQTGDSDPTVLEHALELVKFFDILFYVPPSNEWPVDVSPSEKRVEFARVIDSYMLKAIDHFGLDVITLPWDFAERQHLLCKHLLGLPTV
ncbi:MAG: hypothetical protein ACYSWW_23055 [Planctomycetota bacterium]|jgi:hypothetical protein